MVYLVPGRNSKIDGKLGKNIINLGYDIMGREVRNEFELLRISKQLELICMDIKTHFWNKKSKLIGRSYGGYLIMHALIEFLPEAYPGKVLLLSPVLGVSTVVNGYGVVPPRHKKILQFARDNKLKNLDVEIHTGTKDIGCEYTLAQEIFWERSKFRVK